MTSSSFALRGRTPRAKAPPMRLTLAALLLGAFALAACSGTVKGTGASPDGGTKSGFDTGGAGDCAGFEPCDTVSASDGGKSTAAPVRSEYDALFAAPANPTVTSTSLDGVWAGSMSNTDDDVRVVITPSTITIAVRCNSGHSMGQITTIGMSVSAVTSSVSIRMLESKSVGTSTCRISVRPVTFSRCSTGSGGTTCFNLTDSGLDFGPNQLFSGDGTSSYGPYPTFSKMSDGT